MEQSQRKEVNEAAEKFADAIRESYQELVDRSVSSQELNAQLTQEFFNGVINNLRTQAESSRAVTEDLIEQQRKQQEALQGLFQESVDAYMDLLNSMFSYYQEGSEPKEQIHRTDEVSEKTVWKATGRGAREDYLKLLERTGEMKPGSGELPANYWDLPRPEDPKALVRLAVQEDRR